MPIEMLLDFPVYINSPMGVLISETRPLSGETVTAYLSRRNPVKIILYLDRSLNSLTKFNFDGAGYNMNDILSHNVLTSILNLKSRRQNFYDSFHLSSTSQT